MNSIADKDDGPEIARVCVFLPISHWQLGAWVHIIVRVVLGGAALAGIVYTTWIGILVRRWDIAIAMLALLPWWWLFGAHWLWLLKSIRRGGHPLVLLVSEQGMALGMDDEGTSVRIFDGPSLKETQDELIIENGPYYMVARLPKDQVSSEHADLIRRCIRAIGSKSAAVRE